MIIYFDKIFVEKLNKKIPSTILSNFEFKISQPKGLIRFEDDILKAVYLSDFDIKTDIFKAEKAMIKFDKINNDFEFKYIYLLSDEEKDIEYRYDSELNLKSKYLRDKSRNNNILYTKIEEDGEVVNEDYICTGEFSNKIELFDFLEKEKIISTIPKPYDGMSLLIKKRDKRRGRQLKISDFQ